MTPADELRAAAKKIRALAFRTTEPPWTTQWNAQQYELRGSDEAAYPIAEWTYGIATREPEASEQRAECDTADADWIATMHPGVGTALANVFDAWARMGEIDPDLLNRVGGKETLAVARAVLGSSDG